MKFQPRHQLLEIWRAAARSTADGKTWIWGGRTGRNSISDAEQLLCMMMPATEVGTLKLDLPDQTAEDVLSALLPLGDSVEIPRRMIRIITEYMESYTDSVGTPIFSGGTYFASQEPGCQPTEVQQSHDVVDSFSMAVRLCLAVVGFLRVFRTVISREELRREVDTLELMASNRLTAAMVGLLRSFTVNVFDVNSREGRILCDTVNQTGMSPRRIVEELQRKLRAVNAGLRDLTLGTGEVSELDNPNRLFECGWSWGVVREAQPVKTLEEIGKQPDGVAEGAPYLYFTVVALDGIQHLFSERTRILGLLNEEQWRLARSLQLRWDLTQTYWSTVARFGQARWPLEDVPWRTTDNLESDYFTLLVTTITVQDMTTRQASDAELSRVARVLDELAGRARVTRRTFTADQAVRVHTPGVVIPLEGSDVKAGGPGEPAPPLTWVVFDFSPLLLKQAIRVAALMRDTDLRSQVLGLADTIWDHLDMRRHVVGPGERLWDQPGRIYQHLGTPEEGPSWYFTERVVECLVTAANVVGSPPLRSDRLREITADMLAEADHILDQELLTVPAEPGPAMSAALQTVRASLRRAHESLHDRPGTSLALAGEVLRELDRLAAARHDAVSFKGS